MAISDLLQFRAPAPLWIDGGSVLAFIGWFAVLPYVTTARFFVISLNAPHARRRMGHQTRFAAIAARAEAANGSASRRAPRFRSSLVASLSRASVSRAEPEPPTSVPTRRARPRERHARGPCYRFCSAPAHAARLARDQKATLPARQGPRRLRDALVRACEAAPVLEEHEARALLEALASLARVFAWLLVVAIVAAVAIPWCEAFC